MNGYLQYGLGRAGIGLPVLNAKEVLGKGDELNRDSDPGGQRTNEHYFMWLAVFKFRGYQHHENISLAQM